MINDLLPQRQVLTVEQLNQQVKRTLEQKFNQVWVEGEISNCARPSSGHLYFSLKNANAQVRCALFKFSQRNFNCQVEDGMQVIVSAKVSLYEGRGDYQLIVDYVEEVGDGQLRRKFEQLKQTLEKEGLFKAEHKKSLPRHPKQIGLITSATGAAVKDIISVVGRRFPLLPIMIYPSLVQGPQCSESLRATLQMAIDDGSCDVLVIGRGGGSLEDLWGFNDEALARMIFNCPIPIVSAVGHEIDFTICDFVADVRAPTPSAAAELISPDLREWIRSWQNLLDRARYRLSHQLDRLKQHFSHLCKRLISPMSKLETLAQRLDQGEARLHQTMKTSLINKQQQLQGLVRALDAISPLATLARGYSIAQDPSGTIVTDIQQVKVDDQIQIRLHQGRLQCQVLGKSATDAS